MRGAQFQVEQKPNNETMTTDTPDPVSAVDSPLCFLIPPQDEDFFASHIPCKVQRDIRQLLSLCRSIHAARDTAGVMDECRRLAAIHLERGFSASSLRTKYYRYIQTGDWRVLWDKAK